MKIKIEKAVVVKNYLYEKSGQRTITLEEGTSSIALKSGDLDFSQVPMLEPVSVEGEVEGRIYQGGNFALYAKNITIKRLIPEPAR